MPSPRDAAEDDAQIIAYDSDGEVSEMPDLDYNTVRSRTARGK